MKNKGGKQSSVLKLLVTTGTIIFVSAALLLGVLSALDVELHAPLAVLLTSVLLAVVAGPSVYWLAWARAPNAALPVDSSAHVSARTVTDALTHVMNRHGITMGVLEAMAQAERYNTPLSVGMVDVDHFQRVNDEFGVTTGDKVLADLAAVLADTLRMPDKVGRYGGEEFMIVLPHTGIAQARKIAERIRHNVDSAKLNANGKRVGLTVSIGVTQYTKGKDLEHLLSRANLAVGEAKRGGGNSVVANLASKKAR